MQGHGVLTLFNAPIDLIDAIIVTNLLTQRFPVTAEALLRVSPLRGLETFISEPILTRTVSSGKPKCFPFLPH